MDIVAIGAAATAAVAPFTPFLIDAAKVGSQKFVEVLAERGGDAAWKKAQTIWQALQKWLTKDEDLQDAAEALSKRPDKTTRREELTDALVACLEKEPALAQQIVSIMGGEGSVQKAVVQDSVTKDIVQKIKGARQHRQDLKIAGSETGHVRQQIDE